MSNVLNSSNLDDIFDLGDTTNSIPVKAEVKDITPIPEGKKEDFVEGELKSLLKTANTLLESATYLINSSPDADTVASASNMVNSISTIISEFNKTILTQKKLQHQMDIERMKIDAKTKFIEMKNKMLPQNVNGDVNIIQNNIIPFTQEQIIKQLKEINQKQ